MGFFDRFKRKSKADMGITGQPLEVISGPMPHPDHYDKERNAARIAQLETAITQFIEAEQADHEKVAELKAELAKQLKIRQLFHSGEEA